MTTLKLNKKPYNSRSFDLNERAVKYTILTGFKNNDIRVRTPGNALTFSTFYIQISVTGIVLDAYFFNEQASITKQ